MTKKQRLKELEYKRNRQLHTANKFIQDSFDLKTKAQWLFDHGYNLGARAWETYKKEVKALDKK